MTSNELVSATVNVKIERESIITLTVGLIAAGAVILVLWGIIRKAAK